MRTLVYFLLLATAAASSSVRNLRVGVGKGVKPGVIDPAAPPEGKRWSPVAGSPAQSFDAVDDRNAEKEEAFVALNDTAAAELPRGELKPQQKHAPLTGPFRTEPIP